MMKVKLSLTLAGCLLFAAVATDARAQGAGRIDGQIRGADDQFLGGVTVLVRETSTVDISDRSGRYAFSGIPPGTYTLTFTLGNNSVSQEGVEVTTGQTTTVDMKVDWDIGFAETITIYSASRRTERVVDAPAAVTVVTEQEIERQASHGQLPKLLEFTPGAEVTQSGLYDYNFNTRGFNSSLNRRVATLIDGRDPSVPFLGAQEWAALSFPLDDVASLELVRGPSAALYGANASSGVLNMVTRAPRYSQGGTLRLTGGEVSTKNVDFRWAGELAGGWYLKTTGGLRDTGDFTRSRNGKWEYSRPCVSSADVDCLPQEPVPLALENDDKIVFGGVRADKYFDDSSLMTLEGGWASIEGPAFQTGIGRVQLVDVERPWARVNYARDHWNFLAYYNERDAPRQLALSSGTNVALESDNVALEAQTNWSVAGDRLRLVGGASYSEENIDSRDPATGNQTLMFSPVEADFSALFGQADWSISDTLKLVVAARVDDSSLHDTQFSPKASLVYTFRPNQNLRFSYNEAFQVANYSEFFLQANVAAPINLSPLEGICAADGVNCGFGSPTRIIAVGNDDLDLEEITTYEIGYSGILGKKAFLTLDYYMSENTNFITDLVPQLSAAGRTNPDFQAYAPPAALSAPARATLLGAIAGLAANPQLAPILPILSNNFDGTPVFVARSYTNFGDVDTQGADFGLNLYVDTMKLFVSYSWFDFDVQDTASPLANQLLPNSPEHKATIGVGVTEGKLDTNVSLRWVDGFRWVVGPFQGNVDSYTTIDLVANYRVNDHWALGLNVANLADDQHWESFGGDLLARRALVSLGYTWE